MEEKKASLEVLFERAMEYTRTSITLFKMKSVERISELVSRFAIVLVFVVIALLFFLNLNIGIAILIGDSLGKMWLGFIIVSLFYLFVGLLFYIFKETLIKRKISDSIVSQMMGDELLDEPQKPE
jgi:Zn-dependent protease with chaperone function